MTRSTGGDERRGAARLLLALVLVVAVAASWRWMHANGFLVRPPATEGAAYRLLAARLLVVLEDEGLLRCLGEAYGKPADHTPLFPLVGALVGFASGEALSPLGMWLSMMVFTVILGLGTWWLARAFLPPLASVAATAITLACPIVAAYQRDFLTTLSMVSFLVWTLAALVRTQGFGVWRPSLAFGGFATLATLGKVIAPVYFVGPAVLAAVVGVRRHGLGRVLGNVALALGVFVLVIGPWMARSAALLWGYSDEMVSLERSSGFERLSAERLLYYPLWVWNSGFGFPLGCAVLASVAWTLATRLRRVSAGAWTLAATIPVSALLISFVQTGGRSQYAFVWVPIGVVGLVSTVHGLVGRGRTVAAGLVVVLALWTFGLAQRSVHADARVVEWRGLHLIGGTGQYLAPFVRTMQLPASSEPEHWPVEELTELLLADAGGRLPRLASSHPLVTPNMHYEATMRRRAISQPKIAIMDFALGRTDPAVFAHVDYFVTDSMLMDPAAQLRSLAEAGIAAEVLAERVITPLCTISLVALRHDEDAPRRIHAAVLSEHSVVPSGAAFGDALELRGLEVVGGAVPGAEALNLLFGATGTPRFPARVVLEARADDRVLWRATRPLTGLGGSEGRLVVVTFEGIERPSDDAALWLGVLEEPTDAVGAGRHLPSSPSSVDGFLRVDV